jgi:ion channel
VLVLLVATYFLVSLLPAATWSRLIQEVAVGFVLLITLRTSHARSRLQRLARAGVVAGLVLTLIGSVVGSTLGLVHLVFLLLLVVTPFVILNRILRHPTVSIETVAGAIDVYVILGLIFSSLYRSIAAIAGTPFFVQTNHASGNQFLYFSFATLTTVGYGDLTAATDLARSVVVIEALMGQIFLVTLVARLVSLMARPGGTGNEAK